MAEGNLTELMRSAAAELEEALVARWNWFLHETPIANLASIRQHGLLPKNPDCVVPAGVAAALGGNANQLICLHPLGAKVRPSGTKSGWQARLAIRSTSVPSPISLDWSYEWDRILQEWQAVAGKSFVEFSSDISHTYGSVAAYSVIPSSQFMIQLRGCPDDPATWPSLSEADDAEVYLHPGLGMIVDNDYTGEGGIPRYAYDTEDQ